MCAFLFQGIKLPTPLPYCSSQSLTGCLMHAALSCSQHADKAAICITGYQYSRCARLCMWQMSTAFATLYAKYLPIA